MSYNPYSQRAKRARMAAKTGSSASLVSKRANLQRVADQSNPRLVECAIQRDGVQHSGFRGHYQLRDNLGWPNPEKGLPTDVEGFMDSTGNFLSRDQARHVAIAAGQLGPEWSEVRRPLLSSDLRW